MDRPIKVCFLSLAAYPLFDPSIKATIGGAEVQSYYLAKSLASDPNYEVHFMTGNYKQKEQSKLKTFSKYCP
jgi:hypothetical protein